MSKSKKQNVYGDVAKLLAEFQNRLDALTARLDECEEFNGYATEDISELASADKTQKDMNKGMQESICKLRDSTQLSFNRVSADVKELICRNDALTERVGALESRTAITAENPMESRVRALEAEAELITNFRKAQAAFVLGPTKAPSAIPTPAEHSDVDDECD